MSNPGDLVWRALLARELEHSWLRQLGLTLLASATGVLCFVQPRYPWGWLVGIVYCGVVTAPLTFIAMLFYSVRAIDMIASRPEGFIRSHVYPHPRRLPLGDVRDHPGFWAMLAIFPTCVMPLVVLELVVPPSVLLRYLGDLLLPVLVSLTLPLIADSAIWCGIGRRLCARVLPYDAVGLMEASGYRWSSWKGWRR